MTTTTAQDTLRGFRILRGAVRVGDYIRIANANPSMRDQWWKVTARTDAPRPGAADRVDLRNAAGGTRDGYTLNPSDKIVRHPYSQKLADPANYLPLED